METVADPAKATERSAMQRWGEGGMILPWTKQILGVLWEHLCLFVEVIFYSLMAVFQMFRFEVHLRITEDAGEHIQHMTSAARRPTDSFLLSSLFENNSNPSVDPFESNPRSRSVLSNLVNDELCCSLVDDFVSRATECLTENEDVYTGEHLGWKHGFDWNVLTGSDSSYTDDVCPLTFTACLSSLYQKGIQTDGRFTELDCSLSSPAENKCGPCHQESGGQGSDSEISWGSSDSSLVEGDRDEGDKLWDLLTRSSDPYHPLHFTACVSSAVTNQQRAQTVSRAGQNSTVCTKLESCVAPCLDGNFSFKDDEEALWKSLSLNNDPYRPLNFRAQFQVPEVNNTCGHTETCTESLPDCHEKRLDALKGSGIATSRNLLLTPKKIVSHQCSQLSVDKPFKLPWKRHINITAETTAKETPILKRVTFSPVVHVHKMRVWSFALQAARKGPWEEHARDRDRFHRRILETEQAIGYCLRLSHREKFSDYQQITLSK